MTIRASAPGRCGILGNPSDIYGGFVLSCSVPARATCTLIFDGGAELPSDPTLWLAATARLPLAETPRVIWSSDVPRSSGLAGSTALLTATVACVLRSRGQDPDLSTPTGLAEFAELVRDIELVEAQVVCGYQDAYMTVHGGLRALDFAGKHPIHSGPHGKAELLQGELPFLLVTTGVERLSGSVHGPMRDRWLAGETEVVAAMERFAELGRYGAQALPRGDWSGIAEAMKENQALIRSLGGSGEAIDRLIDDCLACGALAAKLAGAGMGGTVLALSNDCSELEEHLAARGYRQFMRPASLPGVVFEPVEPH